MKDFLIKTGIGISFFTIIALFVVAFPGTITNDGDGNWSYCRKAAY